MVNMPAAENISTENQNIYDSLQSSDAPGRLILRLRFSRSGPAVWLAHLDLMRTFERAVKRADLPVQWSGGYNPRPDLVFALPIGVGLETCADYVDIGLLPEADINADSLAERLRASLPGGIAILAAQLRPVERVSIMARIICADYLLEAPGLAAAAEKALELAELVVDKPSKGKTRRLNIRPLILQVMLDSPDSVRLRVKAGSSENLRPDLFLAALTEYGSLDATAAADARLIRTGLYLKSDEEANGPVDPQDQPMPQEPAGCSQLPAQPDVS